MKITYGAYLIRNKFSKKFLCWNSFSSSWYWGKKSHSEKILSSEKLEQLLSEIEGGYEFFLEEPKGEAMFSEERMSD